MTNIPEWAMWAIRHKCIFDRHYFPRHSPPVIVGEKGDDVFFALCDGVAPAWLNKISGIAISYRYFMDADVLNFFFDFCACEGCRGCGSPHPLVLGNIARLSYEKIKKYDSILSLVRWERGKDSLSVLLLPYEVEITGGISLVFGFNLQRELNFLQPKFRRFEVSGPEWGLIFGFGETKPASFSSYRGGDFPTSVDSYSKEKRVKSLAEFVHDEEHCLFFQGTKKEFQEKVLNQTEESSDATGHGKSAD